MKKALLIIALCVCALQPKAEGLYTYGENIDFQSGFVGSFWHPYMRLSKYNSNDENNLEIMLLAVIMKTSDTYYSFPEGTSKILLKFNDNSISELDSFGDTIKDYMCKKVANSLVDVYFTGRNYIITEDVKQKLLSLPIIKVRIELGNGTRLDYELSEKHGKKVLRKLQKSFEAVEMVQQNRINNANGDLKADF